MWLQFLAPELLHVVSVAKHPFITYSWSTVYTVPLHRHFCICGFSQPLVIIVLSYLLLKKACMLVRLTQFKPMLFKGQLYIVLAQWPFITDWQPLAFTLKNLIRLCPSLRFYLNFFFGLFCFFDLKRGWDQDGLGRPWTNLLLWTHQKIQLHIEQFLLRVSRRLAEQLL